MSNRAFERGAARARYLKRLARDNIIGAAINPYRDRVKRHEWEDGFAMSNRYDGPIFAGLEFDWGDLGRCVVISNPKGVGEAVRFRAADGRTFQNSEAYWRRMADLPSPRAIKEQYR